ncbi:hypothetical protein BH18ACT7_BH18ACT7_10230 [soil metagenome]
MPAESNRPDVSSLLSLGIVLALCLVLGLGLGGLLDRAVGTSPVFLLVGLLLGIVAAGCYTVAMFRKQL